VRENGLRRKGKKKVDSPQGGGERKAFSCYLRPVEGMGGERGRASAINHALQKKRLFRDNTMLTFGMLRVGGEGGGGRSFVAGQRLSGGEKVKEEALRRKRREMEEILSCRRESRSEVRGLPCIMVFKKEEKKKEGGGVLHEKGFEKKGEVMSLFVEKERGGGAYRVQGGERGARSYRKPRLKRGGGKKGFEGFDKKCLKKRRKMGTCLPDGTTLVRRTYRTCLYVFVRREKLGVGTFCRASTMSRRSRGEKRKKEKKRN